MEPLKPGERVEPIEIQTLDGKKSKLSYTEADKKYLLFVLSTSCPHCEKNMQLWKQIVDFDKDHKCNIIGVSVDNLRATSDYFAEKEIDFYMVSAEVDTGFYRKYKIVGVPETILVDGNGVVEKTWVGELSDDQAHQIETYMIAENRTTN